MLRNIVKTSDRALSFARSLRKNMTPAEKLLWRKLRAGRCADFKFRRQVPIGSYIVDFACITAKLIIEIDGNSHYRAGAQERDRKREGVLQDLGFTFMRFGERECLESIDSIVERIKLFLETPLPDPLPLGEGKTATTLGSKKR